MKTTLIALLVTTVLTSCVTPPWVCTTDTCVSIASADLPPELAGGWSAKDGSRFQAEFFRSGEEGAIVPTAAMIAWVPSRPDWADNHVRSFDGRTIVVEQRIEEGSRSPRRFHRLRVEGDRLAMAPLRIEALADVTHGDDVQRVDVEDGQALVYTDLRGMATTLVTLLADPSAWGEEQQFERLGG